MGWFSNLSIETSMKMWWKWGYVSKQVWRCEQGGYVYTIVQIAFNES